MSGISGISGSGNVNRLTEVGASTANFNSFEIAFFEKFNFPKPIEFEEQGTAKDLALELAKYQQCLYELFLQMLQSKLDIIPIKMLDAGDYVIEAYFRPARSKESNPSIHLPLRGVDAKLSSKDYPQVELIKALNSLVETVVRHSNLEQIIRLLIVASHEFGHYLSLQRGNHDQELKLGLYLMQHKQTKAGNSDQYTWLVFREECVAWNFAKEILAKMNFKQWSQFDSVKSNSLQVYFKALNLAKASVNTYYKLSLLGDDFYQNCRSELFPQQDLTVKVK